MKTNGWRAKKALAWLLMVMFVWTGTACAQESFTNGYFTYQVPAGMKPESELTRTTQFYDWTEGRSLLSIYGIPSGMTMDEFETDIAGNIAELAPLEDIRIAAEGVESRAAFGRYEAVQDMWANIYMLTAQKEEQLFAVVFSVFEENVPTEEQHDFFKSWVDTIQVNDTPDWSELAQTSGLGDKYVDGRYYLSDGGAYVTVDDQINEVFVRNPPEDRETLATQNGYTTEDMRETLNRYDADMLIYPQQYPDMRIRVAIEADQYSEEMTFTRVEVSMLLRAEEADTYGADGFFTDHVSYICMSTGDENGQDQKLYLTVVNGAEVTIVAAAEGSLTDDMIAYVENIITQISYEEP